MSEKSEKKISSAHREAMQKKERDNIEKDLESPVLESFKKEKDVKEEKKEFNLEEEIKNRVSIKEILILTIGIILIFGIVLIVPQLIKSSPKTLDQMIKDNYNMKPTDKNYIYNGFSFVKYEDPRTTRLLWHTAYRIGNNEYDVPMHYGPKELGNISIYLLNKTEKKNYTNVYITIDPKNSTEQRPYLTQAVYEVTEKLGLIKNYPISAACTRNETEACIDRPIVTCDSNENDFVIYFVEDPQALIIVDGNCFKVYGMNESLLMSTDKLIYKFLGIME
jgi:hypothetical protein